MTPLLRRIEQALATCTDPLQQAELLAERACYFARTGDFAGAHAIASSLRQAYGDGRNVRISVWIMLIEGLLLFFESNTEKSLDRINRAYAVSRSAGLDRLRAIAGAWLAHMEFERARYGTMSLIVIDFVRVVEPNAHDAWARLGMVLGDAFLYTGDRPQSQHWYELSRRHSTAIGDQATVGALMYNRAAFGLAAFRANECAGNEPPDELHLDFIELELASAIGFQVGTGVTALTYLTDLCKARIAVLRNRFAEATALFIDLRERAKAAHNTAEHVSVDIDLAWCLVNLGRLTEAEELLSLVKFSDIERLDIDDRLIAVYTIASIARKFKFHLALFDGGCNLEAAIYAYRSDIQTLRVALGEIISACAGPLSDDKN